MNSTRPLPIPHLDVIGAPPKARATYLSRTSHVSSGARCLDAAMTAMGATNPATAAHVGIGETMMRALRSGERVLTLDRVLELPAVIARATLQAALDSLDEAPLSLMACERHHLRIAHASGELASGITEAVADGVIDEAERRSLLPLAAKVEARAHALVADLSRGGVR